jgi:Cobalamin synthesis protein cobW C-terminal domain
VPRSEEGDWWVAVPDAEWPTAAAQRAVVLSDFHGRYGDRRQELVFIGAAMDQPAIEAALDTCLVSDEELAKYDGYWAGAPDPEHEGAPDMAN